MSLLGPLLTLLSLLLVIGVVIGVLALIVFAAYIVLRLLVAVCTGSRGRTAR